MRTATTIAKRHDGDWELLFGPDVPLVQQQQAFRRMRGPRSHEEFATVQYQERDGHALSITFLSPEGEKAHAAAREAELQALRDRVEGESKAKSAAQSAKDEAKQAEHNKIVDAHSANIEKIKADQEVQSAVKKPKK